MNKDFTGRPILVSGAGRGLGEGMARHLAALGATVAVVDIDGKSAQAVAKSIGESGGVAHAYTGDLSDRDRFMAIAAAFAATAGPIDSLINNASVLVYEPIEAVTPETLDMMLNAGLKASFWGVQAFLAHGRGSGGKLINLTSPVAFRGRPNTAVYAAIKGAMATLTMVLAGELGPRGIRVNAIAPGSVPTPATLGFVSEAEYARRAANIPLRRLGSRDDVNKAVAWLLSDDASFVNGAMLAVDGGIIAAM